MSLSIKEQKILFNTLRGFVYMYYGDSSDIVSVDLGEPDYQNVVRMSYHTPRDKPWCVTFDKHDYQDIITLDHDGVIKDKIRNNFEDFSLEVDMLLASARNKQSREYIKLKDVVEADKKFLDEMIDKLYCSPPRS